jgi:hypothetical protein
MICQCIASVWIHCHGKSIVQSNLDSWTIETLAQIMNNFSKVRQNEK